MTTFSKGTMRIIDKYTFLAIDVDNARRALEECENDLEEAVTKWLKARQNLAEATEKAESVLSNDKA